MTSIKDVAQRAGVGVIDYVQIDFMKPFWDTEE